MDIINKYKELGALLNGHFLLSSGLHSDKYLQSEKLMMYPQEAEKVITHLVAKLGGLEFTTVVSPAMGAVRFGYELGRQLNKKSIFTERVDDKMQLRRGFELKPNERVLVAEDVITTGKSTKECIEAIESYGAIVVAVTSIIDRSNGTAQFNVPFIPLSVITVQTWDPRECPLCKEGGVAIKPGSRKME